MANYYGHARSNYFNVKDADAFRTWVSSTDGLAFLEKGNSFAIYSDDGDCGGWPSDRFDEEAQDHVDFDLPIELSKHLQEGSVAVLMEVGAEKMRYLVGYAQAVDSDGQVETISLDDIYMIAEERFGVAPTQATY